MFLNDIDFDYALEERKARGTQTSDHDMSPFAWAKLAGLES